ncbi:MAG: PDZ domain-containing protein [Sphingobacteriia bacterium]|nr:PDZ domain-containing protein [Sphingobacteriia bacterium]
MKKLLPFFLTFLCFSFNNANAANEGYFQEPDINGDNIVFVSDNDLWQVNRTDGNPIRLTSFYSQIHTPVFSKDGSKIAFLGTHHGAGDIYVINKNGGTAQRITFVGVPRMRIIHWDEKNYIYFTSPYKNPFGYNHIYRVHPDIRTIEKLPLGPATFYSTNGKAKVLQRTQYNEFGYWKTYRGGAKGDIWIDSEGNGKFHEFVKLESNLNRPTIIKERVYFLSDHENVGKIYSLNLDGQDLKIHSNNKDFYARNFRSDGNNIVYTVAGEIYIYDISNDKNELLTINFPANRKLKEEKFVNLKEYYEHYSPHPTKDLIAFIVRGHPVITHFYNGTTIRIGKEKYRYNIIEWAEKGEFIIASSSHTDSDCIHIFDTSNFEEVYTFNKFKFGRIKSIIPAYNAKKIAVTNSEGELFLVSYSKNNTEIVKVDKSERSVINEISWSNDDLHFTYAVTSMSLGDYNSFPRYKLKLYSVKDNKSVDLTETHYSSFYPIFDTYKRYIYFISDKNHVPYREAHDANIIFPLFSKPYLMTMNHEVPMPFVNSFNFNQIIESQNNTQAIINVKNSHRRIAPFPVNDLVYNKIFAHNNRVWFLSSQPSPEIMCFDCKNFKEENKKSLHLFDFEKNKLLSVAEGIDDAILTRNGEAFLIRIDNNFRYISSAHTSNPKQTQFSSKETGVESGWLNIDLSLKISLQDEWKKIYNEAWSLLREKFNNPRIKSVDWFKIRDKYYPLIDKVSTRSELNDVLWEMQGELRSSHAYVWGGDFVNYSKEKIGKFACNFKYDPEYKAYRFETIVRGDPGNMKAWSPLKHPGVKIKDGDLLFSINNQKLTKEFTPEQALLHNDNGKKVLLEVAYRNGKNRRFVNVSVLDHEDEIYYRDYIKKRREYVSKKTNGKIGYIHIPDMTAEGFSEFYKGYINQFDKDGLIIDIRNNRGGYVSSQIISILNRKRIGFNTHKLFGQVPFPSYSSKGNYVLLINEYTASDGDIFANAFKTFNLGPVIGKRSWGGVIAINIDKFLVDGGVTTQPEFPHWFNSIGWDIENYGVEPNIEVDILPDDYINNRDPQLEKAIEEMYKVIAENKDAEQINRE